MAAMATWVGTDKFKRMLSDAPPKTEMEAAERAVAVCFVRLQEWSPKIFGKISNGANTDERLDALKQRLLAANSAPTAARILPALQFHVVELQRFMTGELRELLGAVQQQGAETRERFALVEGDVAQAHARIDGVENDVKSLEASVKELDLSKADAKEVAALKAQARAPPRTHSLELTALCAG